MLAPSCLLQPLFWKEGTLSSLISDTVDRAFSTFGLNEPLDWKAIFLVPSHDSPIAAWTRCKLGLPSDENARIVVRRHVRLEYAVVEASELEDEVGYKRKGAVRAQLIHYSISATP
jgi:hypothetical protein